MKPCDKCHAFTGGSQKIKWCTARSYKNCNILYSCLAFHAMSSLCTLREISCVFISFGCFMEVKDSNCNRSHPEPHQNRLDQPCQVKCFEWPFSLPALQDLDARQCLGSYSDVKKSFSAINWMFSCVEVCNTFVPEYPSALSCSILFTLFVKYCKYFDIRVKICIICYHCSICSNHQNLIDSWYSLTCNILRSQMKQWPGQVHLPVHGFAPWIHRFL